MAPKTNDTQVFTVLPLIGEQKNLSQIDIQKAERVRNSELGFIRKKDAY